MANQNVKESKKKLCPYWNVGFCKFRDSCRKQHKTSDCTETSCERKTCEIKNTGITTDLRATKNVFLGLISL